MNTPVLDRYSKVQRLRIGNPVYDSRGHGYTVIGFSQMDHGDESKMCGVAILRRGTGETGYTLSLRGNRMPWNHSIVSMGKFDWDNRPTDMVFDEQSPRESHVAVIGSTFTMIFDRIHAQRSPRQISGTQVRKWLDGKRKAGYEVKRLENWQSETYSVQMW